MPATCSRLLSLLCALAALAAGCQSSRPAANLSLSSSVDGRRFEQIFRAARFTRGPTGDVDIVLVDQTEGLSPTLKGRDKPLLATESAPLTHLMHIRVLWKPTRAIRAGSPSASNATVQWTVLSREGGRIDYSGTGFVRVDGGGDPVRVRLSNVRLTPGHKAGDLEDPIGPVTVTATFKAYREDATVATALSMMRRADSASAEAAPPAGPSPAGVYDGPPARSPGP